jgi:peptidoglycan/xylan/chitin deacetylase (PgdA/CDA1 family)
MTGVFFVMTVVLGKPGWMSTRDIKRLADAGMTIGSHTWDHHAVSDLSGRNWKIQPEQLRTTLQRASGQPVEHFAYPYGTVSTKAFPHLRHAGYKTAFQLEAKRSITKSRCTHASPFDRCVDLERHRAAAASSETAAVITQQHLI